MADARESMDGTAAIDWLKAIHAFRALSPSVLKQLYAQCHARTMPRGEALHRQGDPADALHVILQGRFRATTQGEGASVEYGRGAALGEFAFFTRGPHRETMVAVRESVVLRLEWGEFDPLARSNPDLWRGVAMALAGALEAARGSSPARRFNRPRMLAVVHAGGAGVPPTFLARLAEALDERVACQVLSLDGLGQNAAGGIALDDAESAHWLGEQEGSFDLIVAVAGAEPGEWARKAIVEADEVLLVGVHEKSRAGLQVMLNPLEELAFAVRGGDACRLALLHETGLADGEGLANGARRWLELRPVRSHHHVGLDSAADYQRLARFILGQAVGFVASGEGAFAAVNLGLVKALQASGVTLDAFAGSGGGAVLAAFLAMGLDPDDIDALVMEMLGRMHAFGQSVPPAYSLCEGRTFDQLVLKHIPEADLADLRLPFHAVTTSLSTGRGVIRESGGLHRLIRVSWPPLGVLPPFIDEEGELLASGSLTDPLPLARMRTLKDGVNFLCAPRPAPLDRSPKAYRDLPGALRMRLSGIDPFGWSRPPALLALENVLARGLTLSQNVAGERGLRPDGGADVLFTPPVAGSVGAFDWSRHSEIKDAAYQWALAEIDRMMQEDHPSTAVTLQRS